MRKLLMISLGPVMLVLLAATVLAAGRGAGDRATDIETPAPSHTPTTSTSTTTTGPIDVPQAEPPDAPPSTADRTSQPAALHFVCPDGGMDEVVALQHTVDEGHQPWRLSAPDVAAACTFGMPGTAVEPAGTNRYRVNHASSSESAMVDLAQPLGPDGIWVVTSVTPLATTAAAAPCAADAILPTTRQELERDGVVQIVAVKIEECRNGYARVSAVPDNSTCGQPGGSCFDNEQVFLRATVDRWSYLTSGTGISCATDDDLGPALSAACVGLGLR